MGTYQTAQRLLTQSLRQTELAYDGSGVLLRADVENGTVLQRCLGYGATLALHSSAFEMGRPTAVMSVLGFIASALESAIMMHRRRYRYDGRAGLGLLPRLSHMSKELRRFAPGTVLLFRGKWHGSVVTFVGWAQPQAQGLIPSNGSRGAALTRG